MGKNDTRIIHDQEWRKLRGIFNRPDFQKWLHSIRKKFTEYGMDVPDGGFKKGSDYYEWLTRTKQSKRYLKRKAEFDAAISKFKAKKSLTPEEYRQLHEIENGYFPYHWGKAFNDCLEEHGLDPKNKGYQRWLEHAVFLNVPDYVRSLTGYNIAWDEELKKPKELLVRFYGYTKLSDIPASDIAHFQKNLSGYVGRNAPQSNRVIIRNNKIVERYLIEKNKKNPTLRERRLPKDAIYRTIVKSLKKKYPELNEALAKTVIAKWKKENGKRQGKP